MKYLLAFITLSAMLLGSRAQAEVKAVWSTGAAVPGEKVILYIVDTEAQEDNSFTLAARPAVSQASVNDELPVEHTIPNRMDPQQRVVTIKPLLITPDRPGKVEVGDIRLRYSDGTEQSVEVPDLTVLDTGNIVWEDRPFPYGTLWYTKEEEIYVHQAVGAQAKLFLPQNGLRFANALQVESMGVSTSSFMVPELGLIQSFHEKTVNLLYQRGIPVLSATARNQRWLVLDYTGEITPIREGDVGIKSSVGCEYRRGLASQQYQIPLPTLSIKALPLPPNPPADFDDATGQYSIEATTSAKSLAMHEVVEVTITLRGSGNFNYLKCPHPVDAEGWKLIPATRKLIQDIDGRVVGVEFSQSMRPTAEVSAIPAFAFGYFDPQSGDYRQAETRPIPLEWRATEEQGSSQPVTSTKPPPAGEVPVEEMTDIYGFTPQQHWHYLQLPSWLWMLLYLPAIAILGCMGFRSLRARFLAGASGRARERELTRLAAEDKGLDFLKSIGGFIEANIPPHAQTPELKEILARRDEEAFRPEARVELSPEARQSMLRQVRRALAKLATTAALLLLALCPAAWAQEDTPFARADKAYDAGEFSKAAGLLQEQLGSSARQDALINYKLGNCHYRLNEMGRAALHYARALQLDPGLREAKANLAFVQRKEGAILSRNEGADAAFTFFSPQQLRVLTIVSTALLALCLALQVARRGQSRPWLHTSTALSLLLSLGCITNWVYYLTREAPDFALLPPENIAYMLTQDVARSAADDKGNTVITVTASSPVLLLAERGSWSYIETARGSRGWVHSNKLAPLNPDGAEAYTPLSITF